MSDNIQYTRLLPQLLRQQWQKKPRKQELIDSLTLTLKLKFYHQPTKQNNLSLSINLKGNNSNTTDD